MKHRTRSAIRKILCVGVFAGIAAVGAMAGTALAHTIDDGENVYQSVNGGFGLFCAKEHQDLTHGSNGWAAGGWTHSVYGTGCPNQDLNLAEGTLYVSVDVKKSNGDFCDEFTSDLSPNVFGAYAWASAARDDYCDAPASGSKRVVTLHLSTLYGEFDDETVTSSLHSSI